MHVFLELGVFVESQVLNLGGILLVRPISVVVSHVLPLLVRRHIMRIQVLHCPRPVDPWRCRVVDALLQSVLVPTSLAHFGWAESFIFKSRMESKVFCIDRFTSCFFTNSVMCYYFVVSFDDPSVFKLNIVMKFDFFRIEIINSLSKNFKPLLVSSNESK